MLAEFDILEQIVAWPNHRATGSYSLSLVADVPGYRHAATGTTPILDRVCGFTLRIEPPNDRGAPCRGVWDFPLLRDQTLVTYGASDDKNR